LKERSREIGFGQKGGEGGKKLLTVQRKKKVRGTGLQKLRVRTGINV